MKYMVDITNETKMLPEPIMPETFFGSFLPTNALIRKPISGASIIIKR